MLDDAAVAFLVKVEGRERLAKKMLAIIGAAGKAKLEAANAKNAAEMVALARRAIPPGDPAGGHVADTIRAQKANSSATGWVAMIGDEAHKYPFHLEVGHLLPGGKHVPAKPGWRPAYRVLKKRARLRVSRAMRDATKAAIGTATSIPEG